MKDPKENKFDEYDANDHILFFILRKDLKQSDELYKVAICYDKHNDKIKTIIYNALDDEINNLGIINSSKILNLTKEIALKAPKSDLTILTNRALNKALNDKLSIEEFNALFKMKGLNIIKNLCKNPFLSKEQFLFLLDKEDNDGKCFYYLAENNYLKLSMQVMLFNIAEEKYDDLLIEILAQNEHLDILIYKKLLNIFAMSSSGQDENLYIYLKNNNNSELQKLLQEEGFD